MSASLYWEPAGRKRRAFASGSRAVDVFTRHNTWDSTDIPYLNGLADAGFDGAKELIEAINTHGAVEVSVEF